MVAIFPHLKTQPGPNFADCAKQLTITSTFPYRLYTSLLMYQSIRTVDPVLFDRVWRVICELGVNERHFNVLQQAYRALASTWLLACIGAAGFVLEKFGSSAASIPGEPLLATVLLTAIGGAGGLGVLLLWNLDLLVYQRLLDANFVEGLRLEREFDWLPPVRQNMMAVHQNRGIMPKVVWFYFVSSSILLFPVGFEVFFWARSSGLHHGLLILITYFIAVACLQGAMIRRTNRIDFNLDVTSQARNIPL